MLTTDNHQLATLAQEALKARGLYKGLIDGDWGTLSQSAFDAFIDSSVPAPTPPPGVEPAWLKIARKELGEKEMPGSQNNPRIVEYHQATTLKATDDETAWCSAFVNWCLQKAGLPGTRSAMARSFLQWGTPISKPVMGCIVVFSRGTYPQGHVGFFVGWDGDRLRILGGNQGNSVSIASNGTGNVLGYRLPTASV